MADRYWVGGTGVWNTTNTTVWSAASALSFTASRSGTTLTTVGSPALVVGMTVRDATNTSLGTITGGSGNTWTTSGSGTVASQTMKAATTGASVPTAADSVFFDANSSGATAYTVTMTGALACLDITTSALTPTFATGSAPTLAISGSMSLVAGTVWSSTGGVTFNATTAKTITSGGTTFACSLTFNGVAGSWALQDALSNGTINSVTLTNGTLDLNNKTLTCGVFSSNNANTRTIAFGTGNITITGTVTIWATTTVTNLTTTGTQVVNVANATATAATVSPGALNEANSISFNFTTGTYALAFLGAAHSARNVDFTGFAGTWGATAAVTIYGNLTLSTGMTLTASPSAMTFGATSGTKTITSNGKTMDFPLTFNGVGGTWQLQDALTMGSTRTTSLINGTLDLNGKTLSTGVFDSTATSARTIAFGTGNITVNGTGTVWNTGTTTLTVTGTPTVNVSNTTATATTVTTGTPTEAQSISFNFTTGTYALTLSTGGKRDLNFTGFAGTMANNLQTIYGNVTLAAAYGAGTSAWTFAATSGTKSITTNGFSVDWPIVFSGVGGTWQLQDALTLGSTRSATLTNGTLNLNGKTLTVGTQFGTGAGTKNLTFNGGTIICPAAAVNAFNNVNPTNFTTTAGTSTGTISMTAATAKSFVGGGSTYNCTINQGGAGALTITGANTFDNITNTVQPSTIIFSTLATNTFINFNVAGTVGNLVTIQSSVAGTQATISKASGTVSCDYLSIKDSNAAGGASWYAGANSTNVSNNTGWIFTAPPSGTTSNFFTFLTN